jgi:DNA polymerase
MGLPRALGDAAKALGLDVEKDDEGRRLMLSMAKPRRTNAEKLTWWDDEARIDRLDSYCRKDVEVEREIRRRLIPLSDKERQVFLLDAKINQRGVRIDVGLVRAMQKIVVDEQVRLNREITLATGGEVTAASQVSALTAWLAKNDLEVESLSKADLAGLLKAEDLPAKCAKVLEIRQEAAKSSTAKLKAALDCTCEDGRARGLLLYHGAATGRWSGRLLQPQNFTRGSGLVKDPDLAVTYLETGDAAFVAAMYGPPLTAVSDCLRAIITADEGKDLISADFSSVEGRVTAWLAGEEWKLDAFRANDAGTGAGIYELTAAGIFDVPVEQIGKTDIRRQTGKSAELALGFGGGVLAFYTMAQVYQVNMETAYGPLWESADDERRDRAVARYEECAKRNDSGTDKMSRKAWIASELTKVGWRAKHPAIVQSWKLLEEAAREAVERPGTVVSTLKVKFLVRQGFLWMQLPGGRCLAYGNPQIREVDVPWADKSKPEAERERRPMVTALGVNSVTRKWERFVLYPGLHTQNAVQAIARDLMANGLLNVERAGYPVVLTVHDEGISEVPLGFGSVKEYERLMCEQPPEYAGLPLVASGFRSRRYRK